MKHLIFLAGAVIATSFSFPALADDVAIQVASNRATQANAVNPYELLDLTHDQLALRFPDMAEGELDKLVFKIAEINSMRAVAPTP